MGCNNFVSADHDRLLSDSLAGKTAGLDADLKARSEVALEDSLRQTTIAALRDSVQSANEARKKDGIREALEPGALLKLDFLEPTERQYQVLWRTATKLGMEPWEAASLPAVCAPPQVHESDRLVEETVTLLRTSRMPPDFYANWRFDKILFVPSQKSGLRGGFVLAEVDRRNDIAENPGRPDPLRIYLNPDQTFPKGQELLWDLAHELFHINKHQIGHSQNGYIRQHPDPWAGCCRAQLAFRSLSPYADRAARDPFTVLVHEEFAAEAFAAWVTGSSRLCREMAGFFNDYLVHRSMP